MATPDVPSVLQLYTQVVTSHWLHWAQTQTSVRFRRGIYSVRVVLWLMILQRLHAGATLATAVQLLMQGAAAGLLEDCQRVRQGNLSARTGAYCQARRKLPMLLCRQVSQQIVDQLRQILAGDATGPAVFVLDGSSLELEHCRELLQRYPAAANQYGRSHWPVLRIVAAHD